MCMHDAAVHSRLSLSLFRLSFSFSNLNLSTFESDFFPLSSYSYSTSCHTSAGELFFSQVADPKAIKNILKEAYYDPDTVSDELVQAVLQPGLQPGAAKVFLDFVSYSGGPLPEQLIPEMPVPVELLWGEEDPWEPIKMGREEFGQFNTVRNFVPLPKVGHCPMDEAPELVNPLVQSFVRDVTSSSSSSSP